MSITSCLVRQPKNELISNSEQLFNAMDLSPILLVQIYLSTNAQNNQGATDENKNSKEHTIKKYY